MENKLDFQTFPAKEDLCKWVNQYEELIDIFSIVFDAANNEYVVFFYWKNKEG